MVYPAVMLVLLLAACAANWEAFLQRHPGLVKTPPGQSVHSARDRRGTAVHPDAGQRGGYTANLPMLAGPAALVLCLNAAGRRLNAATVGDNFQLVSAKVEHAVAYPAQDAGALRAVSQGLAEPHPSVLVSRPTQIFRSFWPTVPPAAPGDKTSSSLRGCWAAAVWLPSSLPSSAAGSRFWPPRSWRGVGCLAAPLAGTLLSALPARSRCSAVPRRWARSFQAGAIFASLGASMSFQVTARDLFPVGCVSLAGIKPVKRSISTPPSSTRPPFCRRQAPRCAMSL